MAHRKKKNRSTRSGRPDFTQVSPAGMAATQVDAEADADWFDAHPREAVRLRAPAPREAALTKLPVGAQVCCIRSSDGIKVRAFVFPKT